MRTLVETLSGYVRDFNSQEKRSDPAADLAFIQKTFGYKEEDIVVSVK